MNGEDSEDSEEGEDGKDGREGTDQWMAMDRNGLNAPSLPTPTPTHSTPPFPPGAHALDEVVIQDEVLEAAHRFM